MKRNNYLIFIVLLAGFLLNIVTEVIKIYWSLPTLLYSNIIGTVIAAVYLGPIWGALVASTSNLLLSSIGMGNSSMSILFLVKMFEGLLVGIVNRKRKYTLSMVLITALLLSIVIPFIGAAVSTYLFGKISGTGLVYIESFLIKSIDAYKVLLSNRFGITFSNYLTSCILALILLSGVEKFTTRLKIIPSTIDKSVK